MFRVVSIWELSGLTRALSTQTDIVYALVRNAATVPHASLLSIAASTWEQPADESHAVTIFFGEGLD